MLPRVVVYDATLTLGLRGLRADQQDVGAHEQVVVAHNAGADVDSAARIADALSDPDAAAGLWDLAREVGAPGSPAEFGLTEDDVELAAELATAAIPDSNPEPVSRESVAELIRSALRGTTSDADARARGGAGPDDLTLRSR